MKETGSLIPFVQADEAPQIVTPHQVFVCGATLSYYEDESGWKSLDWLRRTFTKARREL